jgi:hypothetical protein
MIPANVFSWVQKYFVAAEHFNNAIGFPSFSDACSYVWSHSVGSFIKEQVLGHFVAVSTKTCVEHDRLSEKAFGIPYA